MSIPQLSRLVRVDVRSVWPQEAASFTPWLLQNARVLGDILGMDIELKAAEHKVGGFSLDLIGRDVNTDEIIIIENQYGQTDHRHLGQLLTYAGGTEPSTVVWIAETFRDEHRAALDWLNQRTDSATRFFGIQFSAVTLAGAPQGLVAPLLEVVVKPNDWGKQVKKTSVDTSSGVDLRCQRFWGELLSSVADLSWTSRKAPGRHWMSLPTGSIGVRYFVSFTAGGMRSELYFNATNPQVNLARWTILAGKQTEFEQAAGCPVIFDELPNRKGCRVAIESTSGESIENEASWPEYIEWFRGTQIRLRAAIAHVGGIPGMPDGVSTEALADHDDEESDLVDD